MNAPLLGITNTGKSILITGAGGCIGSALTQSLASSSPQFLILLDHSEQNLHEINMQLAATGRSSYAAILGDILDGPLMTEIFDRYRPETIYHAAAFKHVPLMESNPSVIPTKGPKNPRNVVREKSVSPLDVSRSKKAYCEGTVSVFCRIACPVA